MIFSIGLGVDQVVFELFSKLRKDILHLAVFLRDYIDNFLNFIINVVAQLSCSLWRLCRNILDRHVELFIGYGHCLFQVIQVISNDFTDLSCNSLQILVFNWSRLNFCLYQSCDCVHELTLMVLVQIVLFSETFLNFFDLKPERGLLFFTFGPFTLNLVDQGTELLFHTHL